MKKDDEAPPPRWVNLQPASAVQDDVPVWAWTYEDKGRIQVGTMALFAGRPGAGKSTCARWFAGGFSRGTVDGCWAGSPQKVAYLAAEESATFVVKPGLRAAGADLDRVLFPHVFQGEEEQRILSIVDEKELTETFKAQGVRVVVVDPIMSTIGSTVDLHRSNEVRGYVEPWSRMAENIGGIVIGIVHLTKSPSGDVVAGVNGSSAFGEIARAVFGFAKDPESDEGHRVMSQAKNSTGDEDLSIAYTVEPTGIVTDSGKSAQVGRFVLRGNSERSVSDVLRDRERSVDSSRLSERSVDILTAVVSATEPVSPSDVAQQIGIDNDIAGKYLRRLAKDGRIVKTALGHYAAKSPQDGSGVRSVRTGDISSSGGVKGSDTSRPVGHTDTSDTRTQPLADRPNLSVVRTCPDCDSPLGISTGKCTNCILSKIASAPKGTA